MPVSADRSQSLRNAPALGRADGRRRGPKGCTSRSPDHSTCRSHRIRQRQGIGRTIRGHHGNRFELYLLLHRRRGRHGRRRYNRHETGAHRRDFCESDGKWPRRPVDHPTKCRQCCCELADIVVAADVQHQFHPPRLGIPGPISATIRQHDKGRTTTPRPISPKDWMDPTTLTAGAEICGQLLCLNERVMGSTTPRRSGSVRRNQVLSRDMLRARFISGVRCPSSIISLTTGIPPAA